MMLNLVKYRKFFLGLSACIIIVSIGTLAIGGLNFGIDFLGGTLLERSVPGRVTVAEIEQVLSDDKLQQLGFGKSFVQPLESESRDETIFLIRTQSFAGNEPLQAVDDALVQAFGDVTEQRTEVVGPVIGRDLQRQAFWALLVASIGVLAYISFRFEYRFGVVAVIALLHDVIVIIGVFSLLGIEVNTSFIAAVLTVVGYSINDTIVVFDRIRENLRLERRPHLPELVNRSINETLSRTINTSLTTLVVVLALYIFGGTSIRDFTLALLVGVVAGTYSSIFVASPLWLQWREMEQRTTVNKPA